MKRGKKIVRLNEDQLNDLLSACTFTRSNIEPVYKAKGIKPYKCPNFIKALEMIERKLWSALRK